MKYKLTVCLFILLLPGFVSAQGRKIYISPDGSDGNTGTIDKPMATLTAAIIKAREYRGFIQGNEPVEIIAMRGEYFMLQPLLLTNADSGTEESPLIIKGKEGENVVFRGGIRATGWEKTSDDLWRAFIPQVAYYNSYFEQLYVNGKRAARARTPNIGFCYLKGVEETIIEKGDGRFPLLAAQKLKLDSTDADQFRTFSEDDFRDAMITFYHKWDNTRKHAESFNSTESSITITGEGMKPWNPLDDKTRYYVENYRAALDSPGEWFLDRSGYLYYMPQEGETPENTAVFIPVIKEFIRIEGESSEKQVSDIIFENISFQVAAYNTPARGNEPAQAAATIDAVITLNHAKNIKFTNCEISHTGTYAFWFRRGCSNCTVNHCYMHDLGAGGIKIGETILRHDLPDITNNINIDNNIITDAGHIFPCAVGIIIFHASDNKLTHNEISDLRYTGISAGWVWGYDYSPSKRNIVTFNHIHHLGWGELCDMGGVYTLGTSEGTVVSNNVIHHIYSYDYGGWGLYTDEGSAGIIMENNLVYACKSSGFHQHYGKENQIRNNIFACNIRSQLQATRIEEHRSISFTNNIIYFDTGTLLSSNWHKFNLMSDYNCYWDTRTKNIMFGDMGFKDWQKSGRDIHSLIADPMFENPKKFNFTIRNLSLAGKINFKPINYSAAGVYGTEEWKKKAQFNEDLAAEFDKIIDKQENGI